MEAAAPEASPDQRRAEALLTDFGLDAAKLAAVRTFGDAAIPRVGDFVDAFYGWLRTTPEFPQFLGDSTVLERVKDLQRRYWVEFFAAKVDAAAVQRRRTVGEVHARINLPLPVYFQSMNFAHAWFTELLKRQPYAARRVAETLDALTRLLHLDTAIVVDTYSRRMNETIAQQRMSLLELSTPVMKLWDGIVLLPIVGVVDTVRAAQMIERLLDAIVENEAQVAILDVTGVPTIDTLVAHHLVKTVAASRMLGAEVIVTGISPEASQTLVKLGADLSVIRSRGALRAGVAEAFAMVGKQVETGSSAPMRVEP